MKQRRGTWMPLLIILLASGACQNAQPTSNASPRTHPSVTTATADPQRCARLAQRGFTPCPPTPDRLQLPPTTIRNATNGAVPDATAQQWARAFQLTEAYYRWAVGLEGRQALTSGVLADAPASLNLFGPDLSDIDEAARAGGTLVDRPPTIVEIRLVAIPADLQGRMRTQQLTPKPYGFAVRLMGPASRSIRMANGSERSLWSVDAQQSQRLLIWGELRDDVDLGRIWYESGLYGCDGAVSAVCGS
jgi:hypothetical protein